METIWSEPILTKHHNRSQNTFQEKAPHVLPYSITTKKVCNKDIYSDDRRDTKIKRSKNFRKTYIEEPRLFFKDVSNKEARWRDKANIRSQDVKQICYSKTFQTHLTDNSYGVPSRTGLDDKNRFITSIFPCTNFKDTPTFFENNLQWGDPSTYCPSLWPLLGASNLCSHNELDCGSPSGSRVSHPGLSRRLFTSEPGSFHFKNSGCGSREFLGTSRLENQSPQVCYQTISDSNLFRPRMEYKERHILPTQREDPKDTDYIGRIKKQRELLSASSTKTFGSFKFCQPSDSSRPATLPKTADFCKTVQTDQTEVTEITATRSSRRDPVVAVSTEAKFSSDSQEECHTFSDLRRSGCGMGRSIERSESFRNMEEMSKVLAFQPKGDVCCVRSNKESKTLLKTGSHPSADRQSDPSSLYKKGGGNEVPSITRTDIKITTSNRPVKNSSVCILPPRQIQQYSRSIIQRSSDSRMASTPRGHRGNFQYMGHTRNRPFRIIKNSCSLALRKRRFERWFCKILQRIQSTLALPSSMGVSTTQSITTGVTPSQQFNGEIHNNCPNLESVFLETRSTGQSTRKANSNLQLTEGSNRPDYGSLSTSGGPIGITGVASWGWNDTIKDWQDDEKQLLQSSWRTSTLTSYAPAIRRWIEWSGRNNVNFRAPRGQDVAKFLANLFIQHSFAYNTILVHKSAISTYCGNPVELSNNFLVKQILKAISIAKPIPQKPPIWDTKLIYDWLRYTPSKNTLFDTARRTAIILLLASGRRIHDLTLLKISEDSLEDKGDKIILWPAFGSKTDNGKYRQSGWCLLSHLNKSICPVHHIHRLISLSKARRQENPNLDALFISITGTVKSASRSIIGGWVRTIFKEVNIESPPGSIRSAVASKGWQESRPVDEILERGNWKCFKTFRNHYYRTVERVVDQNDKNFSSDLLYNNFIEV